MSRCSCLSRLFEPESHPCSSLADIITGSFTNCIAHLWDELGRRVHHRKNPPEILQELCNTFDLNPKWARTLPSGILHGIFIEALSLHFSYRSWHLTPWCGLEVQKPTLGTDLSTWLVSHVNFDKTNYGGGGSINIPCKIPYGKVLAHLGLKSKVLSIPFTDVSAWVGLCTSSPQQGVKSQLINICCKTPNGKILVHLEFRSKVLLGKFKVLHWNVIWHPLH